MGAPRLRDLAARAEARIRDGETPGEADLEILRQVLDQTLAGLELAEADAPPGQEADPKEAHGAAPVAGPGARPRPGAGFGNHG